MSAEVSHSKLCSFYKSHLGVWNYSHCPWAKLHEKYLAIKMHPKDCVLRHRVVLTLHSLFPSLYSSHNIYFSESHSLPLIHLYFKTNCNKLSSIVLPWHWCVVFLHCQLLKHTLRFPSSLEQESQECCCANFSAQKQICKRVLLSVGSPGRL